MSLQLRLHAGGVFADTAVMPLGGGGGGPSAPTIASFSPSVGPVGTVVGVSGTNFVVGATTLAVNGTAASVVTVSSSSYLTFTVPAGATTGLIAITTAGGSVNSATNYTVGVASTSRFIARTNPDTSVTSQGEYPRGVIPLYDIEINEVTGALTANSILWNWPAERVGAARHAAIPGGNRITVSSTDPAVRWTDFKNARATAAAGTGDWEIIMPNGTVTQDEQYDISFPNGRRLYITCATLQTADVMPSLAGAFCLFEGAPIGRAFCWEFVGGGNNITMTGIRWQARAEVAYAMLVANPITATTLADYPSQMVFDRCWMDGNDRNDIRRGILGNINQLAFLETWITDISLNAESTAFSCWSCARFCYARNTLFESAGISFLPGGSAPIQANSGLFDPRDFFFVQCGFTKRNKWMPAHPSFDGRPRTIKNNYETKNIIRATCFKCVSGPHHDGLGQSFSMILKNSDQDSQNLIGNQTQDTIVLFHDFFECSNGFSVLGRGLGTETHALARVFAVDLRFRRLGINAQGSITIPWSLQSEVDDLIIDRWTVLNEIPVGYGYPAFGSGGASSRMWIGNAILPSGDGVLCGPGSTATADGTEGLRTVWAEGANSFVGANVFFGPSPLFNRGVKYPATTEYASKAAGGINATTGALTGDILTRGIGGATPGATLSIHDTFIAAMPWAYGR